MNIFLSLVFPASPDVMDDDVFDEYPVADSNRVPRVLCVIRYTR